MTQSETDILRDLVSDLKAKLADPFCDDIEHAKALLDSATERLALLEKSLNPDPLIDGNGNAYAVNDAGYAEPDITAEKPGGQVLPPADVKALQEANGTAQVKEVVRTRRATSKLPGKSDYDEVVAYAYKLGISANDVHAMWAEIQKDLGNREFDRVAYWAVRVMVINTHLMRTLATIETGLHKMATDLHKAGPPSKPNT